MEECWRVIITGQVKALYLEASRIPYASDVLASYRIPVSLYNVEWATCSRPELSFVFAIDIPEILLVTSLHGYQASQICEMRVEEVASTLDYDAINISV